MMHWVVATAGRTGSNLLTGHLVSMGYEFHGVQNKHTVIDLSIISERSNIVPVVTHDHRLVPFQPNDNSSIIISARKDVFAQACSGIIAFNLKEFNNNDHSGETVKLSPLISELDFTVKTLLYTRKMQTKQLENTKWRTRHLVFYEDLIEDGIIETSKKIGLPYREDSEWALTKSIRRPEDTLENYEELLEHYTKNYSSMVNDETLRLQEYERKNN